MIMIDMVECQCSAVTISRSFHAVTKSLQLGHGRFLLNFACIFHRIFNSEIRFISTDGILNQTCRGLRIYCI